MAIGTGPVFGYDLDYFYSSMDPRSMDPRCSTAAGGPSTSWDPRGTGTDGPRAGFARPGLRAVADVVRAFAPRLHHAPCHPFRPLHVVRACGGRAPDCMLNVGTDAEAEKRR